MPPLDCDLSPTLRDLAPDSLRTHTWIVSLMWRQGRSDGEQTAHREAMERVRSWPKTRPREEIEQAFARHRQAALTSLGRALNLELFSLDKPCKQIQRGPKTTHAPGA